MPKYVRWGLRLIGPLLLVYFLSTLNLGELSSLLATLDPWPLVLSLALMPAFVFIKAWRWNLLMRDLGLQEPPLGFSAAIYAVGLFLGSTTPGQSGDFVKVLYMRDRGQPVPSVLFSIVLDRLFDFAIMAPLAMLSIVVFGELFPPALQWLSGAAALAFVVVLPALLAKRPRERILALIQRISPQRFRPTIAHWSEQFGGLDTHAPLMIRLILASFGSAFITMARIYLLFLALRLFAVPVLAIVASTALIALLQVLPISFSGLGIRDAVLVALLKYYGYPLETAIALSALFLLVNIEHILVGFLVSLRYPIGGTAKTTTDISNQ